MPSPGEIRDLQRTAWAGLSAGWEMISEHVSLVVAALRQVDEPARDRIRSRAIANVSAFEENGRVRVPGVARCIVGTKQDTSGA